MSDLDPTFCRPFIERARKHAERASEELDRILRGGQLDEERLRLICHDLADARKPIKNIVGGEQ